jgi:N-acetylglucosamine malate deacetylase 1
MNRLDPQKECLKILGIFAHPDDAEIWAGGTLINHRKIGHEITIATFDQGEAVRVGEAQIGARILGATVRLITARLEELAQQTVQEVTSLLFDVKPNIVLTHWENDSHPEHRLVFELANRGVTKLRIASGFPQSLYCCDTYNSLGLKGTFDADIYVDVSDAWQQKLSAIDAHKSQSQGKWKEMIQAQGRLNGNRIGRTYAEAFREIPILGRLSPKQGLF